MKATAIKCILLVAAALFVCSEGRNVLIVSMGHVLAHKSIFLALSDGLIRKGHNVTYISAFVKMSNNDRLTEIVPKRFEFAVNNVFGKRDLVDEAFQKSYNLKPHKLLHTLDEICNELYSDEEMQEFLKSKQRFDLLVVDGAYPECAVVLSHHFKIPFIYLNTGPLETYVLQATSNPVMYSVSPFYLLSFTDTMNIFERIINSVTSFSYHFIYGFARWNVETVLRKHFGAEIPYIYDMVKNSSFVLQNSHPSILYSKPYLPNVAEIGCLQCRPSTRLPPDLEKFVNSCEDDGFIYVSMGTTIKYGNKHIRDTFLAAFRQLKYKVIWKYDSSMYLPENVFAANWLPQQDILGHPKIRAFITPGGIFSLFETVYHGVPIVTIPIFTDQFTNAKKAEIGGYAINLDLKTLNHQKLVYAIEDIVQNPKYKGEVLKRQILLKDQKESPLQRAVYWCEYVMKYGGASHLKPTYGDISFISYYLIDVLGVLTCAIWVILFLFKKLVRFTTNMIKRRKIKRE